jgi:hypothetical protein
MAKASRAFEAKAFKHCLKTMGLSDDEMNSVMSTLGITSIGTYLTLCTSDMLVNVLEGDLDLSITAKAALKSFRLWIEMYISKNDGFLKIEDDFSEMTWIKFLSRRNATLPDMAMSQNSVPVANLMGNSGTLSSLSKIKVSDIPKFNGKIADWHVFHMEFTATTDIYGLGELLEERPDHKMRFKTDSNYKSQCQMLFSILKRACARGDAQSKVTKYDDTYDGYKVWRDLVDYYFAKGNMEAYAMQTLSDLTSLKLEYNTPGGMEHYISKHEQLNQKLAEIGQPVSDTQKKTFFLNGIKDKNYTAMCSMHNNRRKRLKMSEGN